MERIILQTLSELAEFPFQLFLFSLPVLGYALFQYRKETPEGEILDRLGLRECSLRQGLLAIGGAVLVGGFGIAVSVSLLGELSELATGQTGVSLSFAQYQQWELSVLSIIFIFIREAIYTTLGEELFFRGLLGGGLIRRYGFRVGNTLQTVVFVLPHVALVWIAPQLWPMLLVWGSGGWVFGWLYHRSGSILPGWIAHTFVNTASTYTLLVLL